MRREKWWLSFSHKRSTEASDIHLSTCNCRQSKVVRVNEGGANSEVVVQLPGGTKVFAIVTRDAVEELGLAPAVSCQLSAPPP